MKIESVEGCLPPQPVATGWQAATFQRSLLVRYAALLIAAVVCAFPAESVLAQGPQDTSTLTIGEARLLARQTHPAIVAARQTVAAAVGLENQAGALRNPTLSFAREQTSASGGTNWENFAMIEQALEIGGQRGARREGARHRRGAAEANLAATEARIDFEVGRAYALTVAAEHRLARTAEAAQVFSRARELGAERLAEGDISGYENRRIALEAGRYAALEAEMALALQEARLSLAALIAPSSDSISVVAARMVLPDSVEVGPMAIPLDSLITLAFRHRPDLRGAELEVEASMADVRLAGRERIPTPTLALGFKNERGAADLAASTGFALRLALPLPLWDRRRGATEAARAVSRRRDAELESLRRNVASEVELAWGMLTTATRQLDALRPLLGADAALGLQAATAAYTEGEIALTGWLDAVRAYHEVQSSFATLQADQVIRYLTLERATGSALSGRIGQ